MPTMTAPQAPLPLLPAGDTQDSRTGGSRQKTACAVLPKSCCRAKVRECLPDKLTRAVAVMKLLPHGWAPHRNIHTGVEKLCCLGRK
ncbi:hypothetical protein GUJ93_ZPchr0015g6700 [Zizania palustris]|uniref:Uncharacterized protein n=1 Tax=Zizania palustris TaxID=103762 RepID=A0A8J5TGF9_ZIZPA|nr:hypothetical protein GUJ93_ZPchr0015g6700 [Zizania palustris]